MDQFQEGYAPEEYNQPIDLKEGDYKVKIQNVLFETTRNGDPMMTVKLVIAEATIVFKHRLVKNEYFNANLTKLYDCFKIPRGNFDYQRWIGRVGKAHIHKGKPNDQGNAYWEIHYLIVDKPAIPGQATSVVQPTPIQEQKPAPQVMPFTDEVPWQNF